LGFFGDIGREPNFGCQYFLIHQIDVLRVEGRLFWARKVKK